MSLNNKKGRVVFIR